MRKKRMLLLLLIIAVMATSIISLAGSASGDYNTKNGNVKVTATVSFVAGPLTIQDKYWGYAAITGEDADAASVAVKGWTAKNTLINTTLNYSRKSVNVAQKSCGYGQTWGKISVTYDNTTQTLTAYDTTSTN